MHRCPNSHSDLSGSNFCFFVPSDYHCRWRNCCWVGQLPYKISIVNRLWEFRPGAPPRPNIRGKTSSFPAAASAAPTPAALPSLVVRTDLVVKSRSHKKMAIGPGGITLRLISESAQADMSQHFGIPVQLTLWVKEASGNQHD